MPLKPIHDAEQDFKARADARNFERERLSDGRALTEKAAEIKEKLDDAKIRQLKNAANGFFDPKLTAEISRLEKEEKSLVKPAPNISYYCDICKDTGVSELGKRCTCFLNYIYLNSYNAVDIDKLKESFDNFNLNLFDDTAEVYAGITQRKMIGTARDVVGHFIEEIPETNIKKILISGKTGLGKSFLLRAAAKAAKARNIDVMLIGAPDLFKLFHMHRLGYGIDLSYLKQAELLIIDDLGTEPKTANVSDEYFYDLLEYRLDNGRYTIIATNESNLALRYNERISSRLYSVKDGRLIELEGADLRNIGD